MPHRTDHTAAQGGVDLDWDDIRTFAAVVSTGSFSEAALLLGINQATVSRRIARLEECAGINLFERSGGGATLSPDGQDLADIAARMQHYASEFNSILEGMRSAAGTVRVKATERVYNYMLTPLVTGVHMGPLQGVMARRPDLLLPNVRLVSAEAGGDADITLAWSAPGTIPDADPDDKVRRLARLRYAIFFTDGYFADGRPTPRCLEDLTQDHTLVSLPRVRGTEDPRAWGRWFSVVDRAGERATVVEWSSVSERLVLSGAALALLPVYTPCLNPNLRELTLEDEPILLDLCMVVRKTSAWRTAVRDVANKLYAAFSEVDWTLTWDK